MEREARRCQPRGWGGAVGLDDRRQRGLKKITIGLGVLLLVIAATFLLAPIYYR